MITLRDYQREAVDATLEYFGRAKGNPLVVLPTGGGKSLVIAETIRRARQMHDGTRCLVLCHRKELVAQDYAAVKALCPDLPVGVYSASLGEKQVRDVTVAQYQSARVDPAVFGRVDLAFVDEAHLVPTSDVGTYRELLSALGCAVVGLTATPYRLAGGLLTRGRDKVFSSICYDLPVRRLLSEGHLAPVVAPAVSATVNTGSVKVRGGDFVLSELDAPAMKITRAALDEAQVLAKDRRSWLVFCVSVEHAELAAECLSGLLFGAVAVVTGETPQGERDSIIKRFKAGDVRAVVNVDVLTTGFDAPCVDCMVMLRPTQSTGLYVQMVGRGMRNAPGKVDCLLLDYAGNVERHGPISAPKIAVGPPAPETWSCEGCLAEVSLRLKVCPECGLPKPPPSWVCRACDTHVPLDRVECVECGAPRPEAPREIRHGTEAARLSVVESDEGDGWIEVDSVSYWRHEKDTPSVGVKYRSGLVGEVREWVCPEHGGFATQKFLGWWSKRGGASPAPRTVDETLERAPKELRQVLALKRTKDGKYDRITDVRLGDRPAVVEREPGCDDVTAEDDDGGTVESIWGFVDDELPF